MLRSFSHIFCHKKQKVVKQRHQKMLYMGQSVSISSDSEDESLSSTGSPVPVVAITRTGGVRGTSFLYTIHTYIADRNDVIDKSFTFRLDRPVSVVFSDQIFRSIHPLAPCLTDLRGRVPVYSKVMLVEGRYMNEAGVFLGNTVVGRKTTRRFRYKILVADSSIVVVPRRSFKLLDPTNILPFGVPVHDWML